MSIIDRSIKYLRTKWFKTRLQEQFHISLNRKASYLYFDLGLDYTIKAIGGYCINYSTDIAILEEMCNNDIVDICGIFNDHYVTHKAPFKQCTLVTK